MMLLDEHFNIINEKLQILLKQHYRVIKENELLRQKLDEQKTIQAKMEADMGNLKQQLSIIKLSTADMSEPEKKEFEKQINKYLKEIDKCIAFLSS